MIGFGREICSHPDEALRREWLVTNGLGGYASGTVGGALTRCYHGLLIAALNPPQQRTLMLSKVDETAAYGGVDYRLFTNQWEPETIEGYGLRYLEGFHLEGTTPVWRYALADALLEKRVWMQTGANTTYIQYRLVRGTDQVRLGIKALANYRDHHSRTQGGYQMQIEKVDKGIKVMAYKEAVPLYLLGGNAQVEIVHDWYERFYLRMEDFRGHQVYDDHLHVGQFQAVLWPGQALTLIASTEADPDLDGEQAYEERQAYEQHLIELSGMEQEAEQLYHLVLAADQFIVRRAVEGDQEGRSVIAGYHWFGDWGRDTMIALPGLTLTTGRPQIAARILRTFARYVDQGMLPNRFPEIGQEPEYNTVDATLWYFEALRAYQQATGDDDLIRELFPILAEIVQMHIDGTRYQIKVDPDDGLIRAGEEGVQLTWMDARVGEWVVTPRIGKPVEINALWYNALWIMEGFATIAGEAAGMYQHMAEQVEKGFGRFWNAQVDYCYDLIDGPDGDDPALRPNQIFAVALPHSPLSERQQRAIVDVCARHLITSYGLRSLSQDQADYVGTYGGDQRTRDAAYHQGVVWGWLIGPFVRAHLKVYGDRTLARTFMTALIDHVVDHGVGSISEIFEGDAPFVPRGCIGQAWSVAEVLRAWQETG